MNIARKTFVCRLCTTLVSCFRKLVFMQHATRTLLKCITLSNRKFRGYFDVREKTQNFSDSAICSENKQQNQLFHYISRQFMAMPGVNDQTSCRLMKKSTFLDIEGKTRKNGSTILVLLA